MTTFREYLDEKFNDMGKLSNDELKKGQKITTVDDMVQVSGRVFHQAITKIKENDIAKGDAAKGMVTLSIYKTEEYTKMKCYLGKNNSSGYAIKSKDLVSVFSTKKSSSQAIMKSAIENGAKTLDCFALRDIETGKIKGQLYELYSKYGFKINKSLNDGKKGEAYTIVNGVSDYVDDDENVHPEDPRVVIFMKL